MSSPRSTRLLVACAFALYVTAAFTVTDLGPHHLEADVPDVCPAPLLSPGGIEPTGHHAESPSGAGAVEGGVAHAPDGIGILQGNAWLLPARPLVLPFAFSTDRAARFRTLIHTVRACAPEIVLLQEVFEAGYVDALARALPDYRVITSGARQLAGTVNTSGLVTLTRLPVSDVRFTLFGDLPPQAQPIERFGRKGFLVVDIESPSFSGSVVNLHLYAYREDSERPITRAQFEVVVDHVREREVAGRAVLVGGDFNLDRAELDALLPGEWRLSRHGATYDPVRNPYTGRGVNDTARRREERLSGTGVRTIDHLIVAGAGGAGIASAVLAHLPLSDHYFLEHRVRMGPADGSGAEGFDRP